MELVTLLEKEDIHNDIVGSIRLAKFAIGIVVEILFSSEKDCNVKPDPKGLPKKIQTKKPQAYNLRFLYVKL